VTRTRASDLIGDQVKDLRRRRNLTAEQLAERCAAAGAPEITAAVIANIETGRRDKTTKRRRRDVTIDELLILACALEVPPVSLLLPSGAEHLAVTPKVEMYAPEVLAWMGGEGYPPASVRRDQGTVQRWFEVAGRLRLLREFWQAAALPLALSQPAVVMTDEQRQQEISKAVANLADVTNRMVESGVTPPPLPLDMRTAVGLLPPDGGLLEVLETAGLIRRVED
jgi:transcriptional regulator with XRE-family HTH domain